MSVCADCGNRKGNGWNVYCRLLGIMINAGHEGCRYHTDLRGRTEQHQTPGEKGRDAPVSQADGQRAAAAGFNSRPACQG